jgi:hypothetical protein
MNKIKTVYSVGIEFLNRIKKHTVICKAINIYLQYVLSPQRKFIYPFIKDLVLDRISEDNHTEYI